MPIKKTTDDLPKPCPFCGCDAKVQEYTFVDRQTYDHDEDWNDGRQWWHVACNRCEVILNNGWPTKGEAVWEWNHRGSGVVNPLEFSGHWRAEAMF